MTHYIMNIDEVKTNLQFKFRYPLHKTVASALERFNQLQEFTKTLPMIESNRNLIFQYLNECDFILNTLEEYEQ